MKLSVIICTKNREEELKRCLKSIKNQTRFPDEIIIVDDGNLNFYDIKKAMLAKSLTWKYIKKELAGTAASRNLGIEYATGNLISFVDDDIFLFENYFEEIIKFFKENKNIGGIDGLIINRPKYKGILNFIRRIFLIISKNQGKILSSGFYTEISELNNPRKVKVLSGCATYKKEVFRNFKFDDSFYKGYSLGEDKDFSFRVGKKYLLFVIPTAKIYHYISKNSRPSSFDLGKMEVAHRIRFFMRYMDKSFVNVICFLWAMFGLISINFFEGLFLRQRISMCFGNISGILYYLSKKN